MNLSDIFVAGAGATVTVLNDQTFNSSGTWTKPTGTKYLPDDMALIELWGGGGGGSNSGASGTAAAGGAGGDYVRFVVPVSSLAATQAVSVGAGGAGAAIGVAGGDTSFAGVVASGGAPGIGLAAADILASLSLTIAGTTLYTPGRGGSIGASITLAPGKSVYGGTGGAAATSGTAGNGTAPGGGGGSTRSSGTGNVGGNGAPGRVRVRIMRGLNQFEISEGPL